MGLLRLILRIIGTWLLGLALILFVIDGTRMLAANTFIYTELGTLWTQIAPEGPESARALVAEGLHPLVWDQGIALALGWPGWAVFGGLGLVFALLGRVRARRRFLEPDQF